MKLKDIAYERIDFEKAKEQIEELIEKQKKAADVEEMFAIHQEYYQLTDHIQTMATIAMFRHSINTVDEFYDKENDYYDEMLPKLSNLEIAYQRVLYHSPFRSQMEQKIGSVAFKNMELREKANSEELVSLKQEENALVSAYEKLLASASFDWEGESLSMSQLGKHQTACDRSERIRAWHMQADFMQSHEKEWDDLFDRLVKNRDTQAKKLGYANYVELGYYRMQRNCYDKDMVAHFRSQVKKYLVPLATKLHQKRAKRIGVSSLELYDNGLYFAEGNPAPTGTPEEILNAGLTMYQELSKETAEFMQAMMRDEMFDVLGRKNKRQGGYMEMLAEPRMPLVFANFNGTSGDVDVITHECGHAFQYYLASKDDIREHWDITMETAETHSMSMEFFTNPWMELFFGKDASKFLKMQLEDAICFIPYGCMVDEFQHIIYENPELSPAERHDVWKKLEKEYRPHLQFDKVLFFAKGGWWQKQHHIYSFPFYYIDYCIAQICALQYKIWMKKDFKEAWESYLKLCKLSASGFFTDMIKEVGLSNPFEADNIRQLVEALEKETED